jgi:hypothetical protein
MGGHPWNWELNDAMREAVFAMADMISDMGAREELCDEYRGAGYLDMDVYASAAWLALAEAERYVDVEFKRAREEYHRAHGMDGVYRNGEEI